KGCQGDEDPLHGSFTDFARVSSAHPYGYAFNLRSGFPSDSGKAPPRRSGIAPGTGLVNRPKIDPATEHPDHLSGGVEPAGWKRPAGGSASREPPGTRRCGESDVLILRQVSVVQWRQLHRRAVLFHRFNDFRNTAVPRPISGAHFPWLGH